MKGKILNLTILHIMFMIFSLGGVASKTAAGSEFMSVKFIVCYGIMLFILFVYAVVWQQMLKRLPLVTAYSNKAVTVVWGIIWGYVFFGERITVRMIIGAVIVIIGVCIVVMADNEKEGGAPEAVKEAAAGEDTKEDGPI